MLLMLALPLQTFASAAMLGCGTLSHQAMMEQVAAADEATAGCHEPEQDVPSTQHNCKHCAACALGAALPIPAADTPAIMPVPTRFMPHAAASFSGFIPDGPERPPRISLA